MQTRKIINSGDDSVEEMLEGVLLARADALTVRIVRRAVIA